MNYLINYITPQLTRYVTVLDKYKYALPAILIKLGKPQKKSSSSSGRAT